MFENILGNEKIKKLLIKSLENKSVSHSYLFLGTQGIGKKMLAIEFAKAILQEDGTQTFEDIDNNPDFKIIEPDGNSLKIEQIREFQTKVSEKPIISKKKVYIINDSDKMTQEAQNCLLKTLEEPPEYVVIILIGENESAFLATIKSRCVIYNFEKLSNEQILMYLEKNYNTKIDSKIMLNAFQGSIGKAIQLREKQNEYEMIEQLIYKLESKDKIDILNMAENIFKAKDEKFEILDYMNVVFLEIAKSKYKYANCILIVEETKKRLQSNANYDMCIDNMLFKLWEEVN